MLGKFKFASTKNSYSKFSTVFPLVVVVAFFCLVILVIVNLNTGLKVSYFEVYGGNETAEFYNQRLRIKFNRPLESDQDWSKLVQVQTNLPQQLTSQKIVPNSPQTRFVSSGDELFVYFEHNLIANQEYIIQLAQEVTDIYGEQLSNSAELRLQTKDMALYYIQVPGLQAEQSIVEIPNMSEFPTNLGMDNRTVMSDATPIYSTSQQILDYDLGADWVAVVESTGEPDSVNKLILASKQSDQKIQLIDSDDRSVYQARFIPGRELLVVLEEKVRYIQDFPVSDGGRKISIYNLEDLSAESTTVDIPIDDISEFKLSPDGSSVIVRDSAAGQYYLVDLSNPSNNSPLGQYASTGGINYQSNLAILTTRNRSGDFNYPYSVIVDAQREETAVSERGNYVIDPGFLNTSNGYFYSKRYEALTGTKGVFELGVYPEVSSEDVLLNEPLLTFGNAGTSTELAVPSPDDTLIATESYTTDQLRELNTDRIISSQPRPKTSMLNIYSLLNGESVLEIENAVSPKWY